MRPVTSRLAAAAFTIALPVGAVLAAAPEEKAGGAPAASKTMPAPAGGATVPGGAPAVIPKLDPAARACRAEVQAAIQKQLKAGAFRMDSSIITERGPMKMRTEYIVPDRMRQVMTLAIDPKPIETIVIGTKAWTTSGQGWSEIDPDTTKELVSQMKDALIGDDLELGGFICRGAQMVDGRELKVYEAEEAGPKDLSPDAAKKQPRNEAARYIFIDPASGLPAQITYAKRDRQDKPLFKSVYTYATEIKIEPPK